VAASGKTGNHRRVAVLSITVRHKIIRHSDVLPAMCGEGDRGGHGPVQACGRPATRVVVLSVIPRSLDRQRCVCVGANCDERQPGTVT